jgi:hypothetical protein
MPAAPLAARIFHATPIVGPLSRAIGRDVNLIFYVLVILVTAMVFAIKFWGLAALVVTYIALVPVIFALLIWITLP